MQNSNDLTPSELERYDRQMMIKGWGVEGQKKLKKSKIVVMGVGGLGSPVSIYLAVGGVGHLVLVDKDKPDLSNMNRQILHWEKDIGRDKAISAKEKLEKSGKFSKPIVTEILPAPKFYKAEDYHQQYF